MRNIENKTLCLNIANLEEFKQKIKNKFCINEFDVLDENIIKIQIKNLAFGVYFLKNKKRNGEFVVIKTDKVIDCGEFEIFSEKKNFYSDLYFLIFHSTEKEKYEHFEILLQKISDDILRKILKKLKTKNM